MYPASASAPGGDSPEGSALSAVLTGVVVVGGDVVVVGRVDLAAGVVVDDDALDGEVVGFPATPELRITLGIRDKGRVVVTGARIDDSELVDVPGVESRTEVDVWVRMGALTGWVLPG